VGRPFVVTLEGSNSEDREGGGEKRNEREGELSIDLTEVGKTGPEGDIGRVVWQWLTPQQ